MSCCVCRRAIVAGAIVTALDKKFHEDCFRCGLCKGVLDGPFYGVNGYPYCDKCIDEAEDLAGKGTLPDPLASAPEGKLVVGNAFQQDPSPAIAQKPDPGPVVAAPEPVVAAPSISNAFSKPPPPQDDAPQCFKCSKGISSGTIVNALNHKFHESCFVCATCSKNLDTFYGCLGLPYCPDCIDAAEENANEGQQETDNYEDNDDDQTPIIPVAVAAPKALPKELPPGLTWEQVGKSIYRSIYLSPLFLIFISF